MAYVGGRGGDEQVRRPGAETFAWVLVLVLGALALAAGFALAPALGELMEPDPLRVWQGGAEAQSGKIVVDLRGLSPESTELVRFTIAVITPLLAALVLVLAGERVTTRLSSSRFVRAVPAVGSLVVLGLIAVGWLTRSEPQSFGLDPHYFGERALAGALLVAAVIFVVALRRREASMTSRLRGALLRPDSRSRTASAATGLAAVGSTAIFVVPAAYTDAGLPDASGLTLLHVPFTFADFAAFGNGATPLADFASQYSNLLPWLGHPVLAVVDYSPGAFTALMAVLSALSLLALWRALALTVRNEVAGLLLYLPVLALSVRPMVEAGDERDSNASLFQILPERYLLPCLVAWLCARHLRGFSPRAPLALFVVAGLALLNNPEFGGPCLLATYFALLIGAPAKVSRARAIRLLGWLAVGTVVAVAIVAAITLVRSGSLPRPDLFTYYSRLFGSQGFGLTPMPTLGFHLIVYVTFAGALVLAAVRSRAGGRDHTLSGLLAYAGCFGLAAGIYYAGRSNAVTMVALFPAWGLALALLTWTGSRWLSGVSGSWRGVLRPVGALAATVMIGFGLATTALLEVPAPWTQLTRLTDDSDRTSDFDLLPRAERFVATHTVRGEAVLILRQNGHLIARGTSARNISLLGDPVHVISPAQLDDLLEDLRDAGGRTVFVGDGPQILIHSGLRAGLRARGLRPTVRDRRTGLVVWRPRDVLRRP